MGDGPWVDGRLRIRRCRHGRDMLLEARFFGLRFRLGVRVGGLVDDTVTIDGRAIRVWGWNYDSAGATSRWARSSSRWPMAAHAPRRRGVRPIGSASTPSIGVRAAEPGVQYRNAVEGPGDPPGPSAIRGWCQPGGDCHQPPRLSLPSSAGRRRRPIRRVAPPARASSPIIAVACNSNPVKGSVLAVTGGTVVVVDAG